MMYIKHLPGKLKPDRWVSSLEAKSSMKSLLSDQSIIRNILLRALDASDYAAVAPHLSRVPLDEGHVLAKVGEEIESVCFPESAITIVTDVLDDGTMTEIGMVGYEGLSGWAVLLGARRSHLDATVRVGGGTALRIGVDPLLALCEQRPAAAAIFLRFVNCFMIQAARTASSNLHDATDRRLARWLLMCHDRLDSDNISLTHSAIGQTLGVRRASVTDALHLLEGEGAIRSMRGRIQVRDRLRLERIAGQSYGAAEACYTMFIAPFGKTAPHL
jgi:CRP-like cAMP-binding protein